MAASGHSVTQASDIAVELTDVSKRYRQRQPSDRWQDALGNLLHPKVKDVLALDNVSLRIARGEVVAYAGPNGAGKSTTIKLLSGLLTPNSGAVRALGRDPVRERVRYVGRIGVVFGQRTELWWDQPVAASFEWKRVVWDIPGPRFELMVGVVRELLGLDEFYHSLARELSLGQRMRADLGMALLHEPEILFLDEPTLGLDVLAKRNILRFIKELNRTRGLTVLVTSHDMSDLEQLAGRIVLIDKGRIAFDGDFLELRRQHSSRRRLLIETAAGVVLQLDGATLLANEDGRLEYIFDGAKVAVADLLRQASAQAEVLDVETHRLPIDEVIADIYEKWQGTSC